MRAITIHNKRPVKPLEIVIVNALGMIHRLSKPFLSLHYHVKQASVTGRISFSENRIDALQRRLDTINASLNHELSLGMDRDASVVKHLVAMKVCALEELADEQASLNLAKQQLR